MLICFEIFNCFKFSTFFYSKGCLKYKKFVEVMTYKEWFYFEVKEISITLGPISHIFPSRPGHQDPPRTVYMCWRKKKKFFLKKNYFSNLQTWDSFPFIYIFFSYFHQCFIFSSIRSFTSLVKCIPIIFKAILNGFVFLISFS